VNVLKVLIFPFFQTTACRPVLTTHSLTDAPDQRREVGISRPTDPGRCRMQCWRVAPKSSSSCLSRAASRSLPVGCLTSTTCDVDNQLQCVVSGCLLQQTADMTKERVTMVRHQYGQIHESRSLPDGTVWNMVIPLDSKDSALRHHVECLLLCTFVLSVLRGVQVSDPYKSTDRTRDE
jgi:hypothetical protein